MEHVEIASEEIITRHLYKDPNPPYGNLVYPMSHGLHVKDPETRVITVYPWCHIDYYKYPGE